MASIISELHSVTFQSKSTTVFLSEINIKKHGRMAPQQHDTVPKSADFEIENQPQKSSPNLDISANSSPPLSSSEEIYENVRHPTENIENPSSDDSGCVQNNLINSEEYQSPLMRLQSALKRDGKIGKKLSLSTPTSTNPAGNNWSISSSNVKIEKNLPSSSNGISDRTATDIETYNDCLSAAAGFIPNNLSSNSDRTFQSRICSNMPLTTMGNNGQVVSTAMYHGSLPSTSAGMYSGSLAPTRIFETHRNFLCRLCDFTCVSKEEYDSHMTSHYINKCPHCNYTSKTEGRLKRHVKEFHSDIPPESWAGTRASKTETTNAEQLLDNSVTSSNGKARAFRCKHCSFIAYQKSDFWKHSKTHIKPDKLLQCDQCDFVTEFKHHYEYHTANHAGRKPFNCTMCNYKCVNKSMLNSHLKSHSSVYQFHCADCKYETKYCHSIKQHLKKQNHKPGMVLNQDGTPCEFQAIDVYGRRRGPRAKKRKLENPDEISVSLNSGTQQTPISATKQSSLPFSAAVSMLQRNIPTFYPSFFGEYPQNLLMQSSPQIGNSNFSMPVSVSGRNLNCFQCTMCSFMTHDQEILKRHILFFHIASENKDYAKVYGINPENFQDQQININNDINGHKNNPEPEDNDKKLFSSEAENSFKFQDIRSWKQEDQNVKIEDGFSPKYQKMYSPVHEENDSFKGFSSSSPVESASPSPDLFLYTRLNAENKRTSPNVSLERIEDNESPIDLSGCKSTDSVKPNKSVDDFATQNSESMISAHLETSGPEHFNASTNQRNRRKGKAYKLDHYVQYDDQSSYQDYSKDSDYKILDINKNKVSEELNQPDKENLQNAITKTVFFDEKQNIESDDHSDQQYECKRQLNSCSDQSEVLPAVIYTDNSVSYNDKDNQKDSDSPSLKESIIKSETRILEISESDSNKTEIFECNHCGIVFKNLAMYSVHMGYHGYKNPFTCNLCGHVTANEVEFFVHIARVSHI